MKSIYKTKFLQEDWLTKHQGVNKKNRHFQTLPDTRPLDHLGQIMDNNFTKSVLFVAWNFPFLKQGIVSPPHFIRFRMFFSQKFSGVPLSLNQKKPDCVPQIPSVSNCFPSLQSNITKRKCSNQVKCLLFRNKTQKANSRGQKNSYFKYYIHG